MSDGNNQQLKTPEQVLAEGKAALTEHEEMGELEQLEHQLDDEARMKQANSLTQPVPGHEEVMVRADGRYCVGVDPAMAEITDPVALAQVIDSDRLRAFGLAKQSFPIDTETYFWYDATVNGEPFWSFRIGRYDGQPVGNLEKPVKPEPEPVKPTVADPKPCQGLAAFDPDGVMVSGAFIVTDPSRTPDQLEAGRTALKMHVASMIGTNWRRMEASGYTIHEVGVIPNGHIPEGMMIVEDQDEAAAALTERLDELVEQESNP